MNDGLLRSIETLPILSHQTSTIHKMAPTTSKALVKATQDAMYEIVPEKGTTEVDTSEWPLLLRNYNRREERRHALHIQC